MKGLYILVCKPSKTTQYKKLPIIPTHAYILDSLVYEH